MKNGVLFASASDPTSTFSRRNVSHILTLKICESWSNNEEIK